MTLSRLTPLVVAMLAAAAILAPAARANTSQESIFQDDSILLNGHPGPSLDLMQAVGTTTIHSLAFWNHIAPHANSTRRPSGDLSNPNSYPASSWAPYDALVRETQARGMGLLLTPTGFAPKWAECRGGRNCKPNAKLYGQFVTALGRRYSGTFKDASGNVLPPVSRWSLWNEPDQQGWLNPQPQAPKLYRDLVYAGLAALRKTGHSHDQVLLGETAPVGRGKSTDPTTFLLNLFCIDSHGHRLHGRASKAEGCTHFKRFTGITGFAHHPYNTSATGPALRTPHGPGDITLATMSRLTKVLRLAAHSHAVRSGLPIYFTEYGIQTHPPNRKYGVPVSKQAMWLNQADYLAYRNRAVHSVAQYELFDGTDTSIFTTGLIFHSGKQKPSYGAYRLPVWASKKGSRTSLWLWVRPAAGKPQNVLVQHDTGGGFVQAAQATTNSRGFATLSEPGTSGRWRIAWTGPDGTQYFSRIASVRDH
ncbi:MAG TPA: hypothetical protein VGF74_16660 [Thermoleophilaceae bacterium]